MHIIKQPDYLIKLPFLPLRKPTKDKMDTHLMKSWWEVSRIFNPLLPELAIRVNRADVLFGIARNSLVVRNCCIDMQYQVIVIPYNCV